MKMKYLFTIFFSTSILYSCNVQNQQDSTQKKIFGDIQKSHLNANIPDQSQFDGLLKRDLEKFFATELEQVVVKWEFLREGPTQSGVAFPKYYLWTKIYTNGQLSDEGAVRVAAVERTGFDITHFVSVKEISKQRIDIYTIFPKAVCEKIKLQIQHR